MGYALAMGNCITCGNVFCFNPVRVPSTSAITGKREPICLNCMTIANRKRAKMGMKPHPIHDDAYEAIEESEL